MELGGGKNGRRIVLSESSFASVGNILQDLIRKTHAQVAIFADMDGYSIMHRSSGRDAQIPTLTALAAGSFSATAEMAKIIGEKQKFRFLYHEGEHFNLYLSTVGDSHLIIVAFESTVALGMVRIFTNLAVSKLNNMLEEITIESKETADFWISNFAAY